MILFNILIGLALAIIVVLPLIWIKHKVARLIVIVIAIGGGVITTQLSEIYLYPRYVGWQFERENLKQPLFSLIAQYHPKEYQAFIEEVKKGIRKGEDINIISSYSSSLLNQIFYQHLQNAPDEAIFIYLKATLDLYRYLYSVDPRAVVKLENGDSSIPVNLTLLWQDQTFKVLLNHLLEAKGLVIQAAIKNPVNPPQAEQAIKLLDGILDSLSTKFGAPMVRMVFIPSEVRLPAVMVAPLLLDFYVNLITAGKENAGIIMRYIAANKEKSKVKK
ncbi:MAG: hypothetical protein ACHQJ6_06755 [Candidatus Berkiellales bacterium]